jgi:hypothetical protein
MVRRADNWLASYGYTALLLPRADIHPMDVLWSRKGREFNQKVGSLLDLFSCERDLPAARAGEPTGSITRRVERRVEVSLGMKILGSLLGATVAAKLGNQANLSYASSLLVSYDDVRQDAVAVLQLDSWLENARPAGPSNTMVWLNNAQLAVVTAVLRSTKLSVVAETASGTSLELNVPEIQGLISGDVKVEGASGTASKLTFEGTEPIAFGFQAFVMRFEGNISFGLEETRGPAAISPEDFSDQAVVGEHAVDELKVGPPLGEV